MDIWWGKGLVFCPAQGLEYIQNILINRSQWGPLLPASAFVRYRAHPTPGMAPFSDTTDTSSSGFFLPRPCPPLRAGVFALGTYKDETAVVSWAFL